MKKYKNELDKNFPYKDVPITHSDHTTPVKDKFISFTVAPYCLPKLLLSFYQNNIFDFSITQQDNDLCVSVGIANLERVVYPRNIKQDKDMKQNDDTMMTL